MTLAELIKARGITSRQGAKELGITDAEMSRLVKRRREPSLERAAQIMAWSGGQITITELTAIKQLPSGEPTAAVETAA